MKQPPFSERSKCKTYDDMYALYRKHDFDKATAHEQASLWQHGKNLREYKNGK